MLAGGSPERALMVGSDMLSKILDWTDRSTLVLFGDGPGAVVIEPVETGASSVSSSARTGAAATTYGSRAAAAAVRGPPTQS